MPGLAAQGQHEGLLPRASLAIRPAASVRIELADQRVDDLRPSKARRGGRYKGGRVEIYRRPSLAGLGGIFVMLAR